MTEMTPRKIAVKSRKDSKIEVSGYDSSRWKWHETRYYATMSLTQGVTRVDVDKAGPRSPLGVRRYDVRVIPFDDAAEIAAIDHEIRLLRIKRQKLLDDRFMRWAPVTRADCHGGVVEGNSKAEATKQAKEIGQPTKTEIAAGRRLRRAIFG